LTSRYLITRKHKLLSLRTEATREWSEPQQKKLTIRLCRLIFK
jgi:hypothetical protein